MFMFMFYDSELRETERRVKTTSGGRQMAGRAALTRQAPYKAL